MSTAPSTDNRTLFTERVLPAPPAAIFGAIANPNQLARWWGPNGFHNSIQAFDFRPGGRWLVTLHGPDGRDYPNEYRFADIAANELVVIEHVTAHWFELSISLAPQDGGTRVGWRQTFADAESCARLAPVCTPGNEQNLDRLAAVLAASG
ncbi:SRPBCC family protein [Alicycliphilus denitrificans]|uniref:SRPBCC family protein n=1 Tax=Alicycliphilus denitrificans TaxID=179636 RepID=UPI00384DD664